MAIYRNGTLIQVGEDLNQKITSQMRQRVVPASFELRNAAILVLRGQRHGRRYNVPGTGRMTYNRKNKTAKITRTKYTASAPGEAPANRTGVFRLGWIPTNKVEGSGNGFRATAMIEHKQRVNNGRLLGDMLEHGTARMAPRPHHKRIIDKAMPDIVRIYSRPY